MMIQGKPENIFDNEDFARMLDERLGYECGQYFRDETDPYKVLEGITDEEIMKCCSGECDEVQRIQEHYQNILQEIREIEHAVYEKILEGYNPGSRRTKKEQFALDKIIEIHKIVRNNT